MIRAVHNIGHDGTAKKAVFRGVSLSDKLYIEESARIKVIAQSCSASGGVGPITTQIMIASRRTPTWKTLIARHESICRRRAVARGSLSCARTAFHPIFTLGDFSPARFSGHGNALIVAAVRHPPYPWRGRLELIKYPKIPLSGNRARVTFPAKDFGIERVQMDGVPQEKVRNSLSKFPYR